MSSPPPADRGVAKVIDYLENPKVIGKAGNLGDLVDYKTRTLTEMIYKLTAKQLSQLLERVVTVCAQWNSLRVAPNNSIGTIARYQEANLIIGKWYNTVS